MDDAMTRCIDNCKECALICQDTLDYCREKGGAHADEKHLKLLEDCVQMCEMSISFMQRESDNHARICAACADICEQCAESCASIDPDDEVMQRCAEVCRRCVESCREMA